MSHQHTFKTALLSYSNAQITVIVTSYYYYLVEDWSVLLPHIQFLIIYLPETKKLGRMPVFGGVAQYSLNGFNMFATVTRFEKFRVCIAGANSKA